MLVSEWIDKYPRLNRRREQIVLYGSVVSNIMKLKSDSIFIAGYPKSGTNWLTYLVSAAFGIPALEPWKRLTPSWKSHIFHIHNIHLINLARTRRRTIYLIRDGRDVVVSAYFHHVRECSSKTRHRLEKALNRPLDREHARDNLPRYIEYLMTHPFDFHGLNYAKHIDLWRRYKSEYILVRYEDLLANGPWELERIYKRLFGQAASEACKARFECVSHEHEFSRTANRRAGIEDTASFLRKGVHGDWMNYFTKEASLVYSEFAGHILVEFGYEKDCQWVTRC